MTAVDPRGATFGPGVLDLAVDKHVDDEVTRAGRAHVTWLRPTQETP